MNRLPVQDARARCACLVGLGWLLQRGLLMLGVALGLAFLGIGTRYVTAHAAFAPDDLPTTHAAPVTPATTATATGRLPGFDAHLAAIASQKVSGQGRVATTAQHQVVPVKVVTTNQKPIPSVPFGATAQHQETVPGFDAHLAAIASQKVSGQGQVATTAQHQVTVPVKVVTNQKPISRVPFGTTAQHHDTVPGFDARLAAIASQKVSGQGQVATTTQHQVTVPSATNRVNLQLAIDYKPTAASLQKAIVNNWSTASASQFETGCDSVCQLKKAQENNVCEKFAEILQGCGPLTANTNPNGYYRVAGEHAGCTSQVGVSVVPSGSLGGGGVLVTPSPCISSVNLSQNGDQDPTDKDSDQQGSANGSDSPDMSALAQGAKDVIKKLEQQDQAAFEKAIADATKKGFKQTTLGSNDISEVMQVYRSEHPLPPDAAAGDYGNVAAVRYVKDGNEYIGVARSEGYGPPGHAEARVTNNAWRRGFAPDEGRTIASERQPCGSCDQLIQKRLPGADVEYHLTYSDEFSRTLRQQVSQELKEMVDSFSSQLNQVGKAPKTGRTIYTTRAGTQLIKWASDQGIDWWRVAT